MALNDWSDRDLDAVERPERPIPSGRVTPRTAFTLASALTATGLALSALSGGRATLRTSTLLAATAWTYDLAAKNTPVGPVVMATARSLDVLVGAGPTPRAALRPALAIGTHILTTTLISRGEVHGSTPTAPRVALAATAAITAATATNTYRKPHPPAAAGATPPPPAPKRRSRLRARLHAARLAAPAAPHPTSPLAALRNAAGPTRSEPGGATPAHTRPGVTPAQPRPGAGPAHTRPGATPAFPGGALAALRLSGAGGGVLAAVFAGLYARSVGRAQLVAAQEPSAENLRKAVGAGIHGLVPLQAAWCAKGGKPLVGAGLMAALPLAKALARKISPT